MEVASGLSETALAIGVEKMTDVGGGEATYGLATAADQDYEAFHGVTFPGLLANLSIVRALARWSVWLTRRPVGGCRGGGRLRRDNGCD